MTEKFGNWNITRESLKPGSVFKVPSKSVAGKFYYVIVGPRGGVKCECPGFVYRNYCSHVKEVRGEI